MGRTLGFRSTARLAAVGALVALAACGGSSSGPTSNPTPAPTPTPCAQKVIDSDSGSLPSKTLVYYDFSVPDSGRLDITLDWTYASNNMGLYVTPANTCTLAEFNARSCNFVIRSDSGTKPRKVSANVTAGNFRWLIGNFGATDDSVSYQVVLSTGSCPALTNGGPGASAVSDAATLEAARPVHH
jgi:hypothetical protein